MEHSKELITFLGKDDYFLRQYIGKGLPGKIQGLIFTSRIRVIRKRFKKNNFSSKKLALDVGCGPMFEVIDMSKYIDSAYIGIDLLSCAKLKKYRDIIRAITGKDIEVVRASGDYLPFQTNTFDLIYALDVLEHLNDPKKCIEEIKLVAQKGSNIVISLPLENFLQKVLRLGFIMQKINGDATVKKASFRTIIQWVVRTPPYHYPAEIKSYNSMKILLKTHFNSSFEEYSPFGIFKSLNINAILFFTNK